MIYVLIIDDDEDDREMFCDALSRVDPNVVCIVARNGEEALNGLRSGEFPKPHLIFLDLNMPRINGFECLKYLKGDHDFAPIPVIIYTTSHLQKDKDETRRLGAAHFITKPNTLKELCDEISSALALAKETSTVTDKKH